MSNNNSEMPSVTLLRELETIRDFYLIGTGHLEPRVNAAMDKIMDAIDILTGTESK